MAVQEQSTDLIEPVGIRKSRIAGAVLTSLMLIVMGLANLPYQYVEVESEWIGIADIEDSALIHQYQATPIMAGWPLRYWVRYDREGNPQDRFWSAPRLTFNLLFVLVCGAVVYSYIHWRYQHIQRSGNKKVVRAVWDTGIALAIFLIPVALLAWSHREAMEHRRLGYQLSRYGNSELSAWLPEPVVEHVPKGLVRSFQRLRQVHVVRPDPKLARAAASVPTLSGFHCYAGPLTVSTLEPLVDNVHFCSLELGRLELSEADLDLIGRLRWIAILNLAGTNLDSELLSRIDHLPLKNVNLALTPLELSELGDPGWSQTVEELQLTRPPQGVGGSLTIEGWPQLRRLRVSRMTTRMNPNVFKVKLSNLPNLHHLALDRLQKHDCTFHDLPRWRTLDEGLATLRFVLHFENYIPGLAWFTNLDIDGAASLTEIGCFARDLESLSVRNAPNVRTMAIGSYYSSGLGEIMLKTADPVRCQEWINEVGRGNGPSKLDLTALPMAEVDLSPLAQNQRIRHIELDSSGVTFAQIQGLRGMRQLESLDVSSCPLQQDELSWILDGFPNLKDLSINGTDLTRFDLTGSTKLKNIRMPPLQDARDIRIVDLPSLKTHVRLTTTPRVMEIRNAPSLLGLAVEQTWPQGAAIDGLRDLEWFAGGGKTINDALLDKILACGDIDQLTLAYTSVSREKFKEIGRLDRLSLLAVPGAPIDDNVTAHWHRLKSLWEVNLDDTSISVKTLAWLSKMKSLRRLSLNRVKFNDDAADALSRLTNVSEIHLAGVSIPPEKLTLMLERGNLDAINLTGWEISDKLVNMLAEADSIQHMNLSETDIDSDSLQKIMTANPVVYVEVGDRLDILTKRQSEELKARAALVARIFNTGWRHSLPADSTTQLASLDDGEREITWADGTEKAGRIDPRLFRPKPIASIERRRARE